MEKIINQEPLAIGEKVIVLRGGIVTPDSIRNGAEKVDTRDVVYNLSVQLSPGNEKQTPQNIDALLEPTPYRNNYALTFSRNILKAGGTILRDRLEDNRYHGLVSGVQVDTLYDIFRINQHRADAFVILTIGAIEVNVFEEQAGIMDIKGSIDNGAAVQTCLSSCDGSKMRVTVFGYNEATGKLLVQSIADRSIFEYSYPQTTMLVEVDTVYNMYPQPLAAEGV